LDKDADSTLLVERAKRGDQAAWAAIYQLAYPRLLPFAQRRLGSPDAGRDAVSETMVRAVAGIENYRYNDDGITPWLFGICRNVVAEAQRRNRRFVDIEPPEQAVNPDPAQRLIAEEDGEAVRRAFSRLDPRERELLELRVVGKLSSEQAAIALGIKPGAVRMAQMRALARLRTFVEEGERVG
jgi:RNA polymerase sigma-70 factor (ECF subfamily)